MTPINLANWSRSQHFALFKDFSQPYFNVCIKLSMQQLYDFCKENHYSFFQAYIYITLKACHAYPPIRQRIVNNQPFQLATVRASVVELADDDTFRFSYFSDCDDFSQFQSHADKVSAKSRSNALFSNEFNATEGQADLIHISVLPWFNFTSFAHATHEGASLAIPKFVFGQYDAKTGEMPLAIDVHHALMDGLHVAQFIAIFERKMALFCNQPR